MRKKLIIIGIGILMFLLLISCTKQIVPVDVDYEIPLLNNLENTKGYEVNLYAEVFPSVPQKWYVINIYSSQKLPVEYYIIVKWYHSTGKVYQYKAWMPQDFKSWFADTRIPIDYPLHVLDKPEIVSVQCSDPRYKFKW